MSSTEIATRDEQAALLERVVVEGDLSKLTPSERVEYYSQVCRSLGLNPLTRPFQYLRLSGRLVLYATKDATDQLRRLHQVSITITSREKLGDIYVVTARATTPDGRTDESMGAVPIAGLKGESLANALMKAEAKAKRRATLSIVGLGWTDATEVESIPAAAPVDVDPETGEIREPERDLYQEAVELLAGRGLTGAELEVLAAKAAEAGDPQVLERLTRVSTARLRERAAELLAEEQAEDGEPTDTGAAVDDESAEDEEFFGPREADIERLRASASGPRATGPQLTRLGALAADLERAGIDWRADLEARCGVADPEQLSKAQAAELIRVWADLATAAEVAR